MDANARTLTNRRAAGGIVGVKLGEQLDEEALVEMRVAWIGLDELPIHMANQFVSQFQSDGFVLTVGSFVPPMLLGTPAEQMEQARTLGYAAIRPIVRISLSLERMRELVKVLSENLHAYDESKVQQGGQ